MTIGLRVECLLKELKLTQQEFADAININQSYVSQIIHNRAEPSKKVYESIVKTFHVSRSWLESGGGEMFEQDTPSSDAALLALKKELLELVDRMNEEQASHALSYLKFLLWESREE